MEQGTRIMSRLLPPFDKNYSQGAIKYAYVDSADVAVVLRKKLLSGMHGNE